MVTNSCRTESLETCHFFSNDVFLRPDDAVAHLPAERSHTMVKIIPHCETSFEKLSAGVPPNFLRGSPREMVRLE